MQHIQLAVNITSDKDQDTTVNNEKNNKLQQMAAKLCLRYNKKIGWVFSHPFPGLTMTGQSQLTNTEGMTHYIAVCKGGGCASRH